MIGRIEGNASAGAAAPRSLGLEPRQAVAARVWLASAVQEENVNSTTHILGVLAKALAAHFELGVLSPPRSAGVQRGLSHRDGTFRRWLADRTVRALTGSLRVAYAAVRRVRRGDLILVVTNPPLLPVLMAAVAGLRRARLVVVVHDVYPDALHVTGVLRSGSISSWLLGRLICGSLRRADRVIVIGRDMKSLMERRLGAGADRVVFVPNWADPDVLWTQKREDSQRVHGAPLVVQYSGNMGATHPVEVLLDTATLLQEQSVPAQLDVYGWGLRHGLLTSAKQDRGLHNMEIGGPCSRSELGSRLAGCDVALILMRRGMAGISVPSRLYNVLAAGRPIIAAVDADSEVAMVVGEHELGWIVEPEDPHALAAAICDAVRRRDELRAMGIRAAWLGTHQYSFATALGSYLRVLEDVVAE